MFSVVAGDRINSHGITVTIDKVLYSDCFDGVYDIEFIDTTGKYRHWKQEYDGGELITDFSEKVTAVCADGVKFREVISDIYGDEIELICLKNKAINNKYVCFLVWESERFCRKFFGETEEAAYTKAAHYAEKNGFSF